MSPKLAVGVLIYRADAKILLVRRADTRPAAGFWTLVTGRLEAGETHEHAAIREVAEETQLTIELEGLIDVHLTSDSGFELRCFSARLTTDQPLNLQRTELSDYRWVDEAQATLLSPMFPQTKALLARWFRRTRTK